MFYIISRSCLALPMPLNGNGPRIIFWRTNFEPQDFTSSDISQYIFTLLETLLLSDPYACLYGVAFLTENTKTTIAHLPLLSLNIIKTVFTFFESAYPIRIKAFYLKDISPIVERSVKMLLPYTPEKVRNRVSYTTSIFGDRKF